MGGGGGIRKFSSLKWGASQKLKAEEVLFTGKCTGLMGHLRENWRVGPAKFFRDNQKTTAPPPPPPTHKKWTVPKVEGIHSSLFETDGSKADSLLTFWTRLSALDKMLSR